MGNFFRSVLGAASARLQAKIVNPSTSAFNVNPDSGYDGLSQVAVNAISPNLSDDTRYQHASNNSTPTLIGDAGFFTTVYDRVSRTNLGNYFEIRFNGSKNKSNANMSAGWMNSNTMLALPSQTKTITASRSKQTVTPDSNKVLQSVTVNKYPDASGTYGTITSNGTHDMGATNNYRYVGVSVPQYLASSAGDVAIDTYSHPYTFNCKVGDIIILNHDGGWPSSTSGLTYIGSFNNDNRVYRATSTSVTVDWSSGFMDIGKISY